MCQGYFLSLFIQFICWNLIVRYFRSDRHEWRLASLQNQNKHLRNVHNRCFIFQLTILSLSLFQFRFFSLLLLVATFLLFYSRDIISDVDYNAYVRTSVLSAVLRDSTNLRTKKKGKNFNIRICSSQFCYTWCAGVDRDSMEFGTCILSIVTFFWKFHFIPPLSCFSFVSFCR